MKIVLLLGMAIALAGCQRADAGRPAAMVVAKVNGAEISAHQAPSAQALENVIDRELLVQKALASGLERDPAVAQSLETARRQVLAQAYVERISRGNPTSEEVRAFYAENPALFSDRRVYRLQELVVTAPAELVDVLRAEAARMQDLEQVAAWLQGRNARFSAAALTQQQAAPLIEQFLAGRKRLETAAAEVRRLRESARIEYVGDFKAR